MQMLSLVQPDMAAFAAAQAAALSAHSAAGGQGVPQPWLQPVVDWQQHQAAAAAAGKQQAQGQKQQQGSRGGAPAAAGAAGSGPVPEKCPSSGAAPNSYMQPQPAGNSSSIPAAVPVPGAAAPAVPAPLLGGVSGSAGGALPGSQPNSSTAMAAALAQGHLPHPFVPPFGMLHPGAFPLLPWGIVPMVAAGAPHGFGPGPHVPGSGGGAAALAAAAAAAAAGGGSSGGSAARTGEDATSDMTRVCPVSSAHTALLASADGQVLHSLHSLLDARRILQEY
jgi:hypothetical protein